MYFTVYFSEKPSSVSPVSKPKSAYLASSSWMIDLRLCNKDNLWAFNVEKGFVFSVPLTRKHHSVDFTVFFNSHFSSYERASSSKSNVLCCLQSGLKYLYTSGRWEQNNRERIWKLGNDAFGFDLERKMLSFVKFRTRGVIFWMVNGTDNRLM